MFREFLMYYSCWITENSCIQDESVPRRVVFVSHSFMWKDSPRCRRVSRQCYTWRLGLTNAALQCGQWTCRQEWRSKFESRELLLLHGRSSRQTLRGLFYAWCLLVVGETLKGSSPLITLVWRETLRLIKDILRFWTRVFEYRHSSSVAAHL